MRKILLALAMGVALAASGVPASAQVVGLTERVWDAGNFPDYQSGVIKDATITQELAWANANTPTYTFTNTSDKFQYGTTGATVAKWFSNDAAGTAKNDNYNPANGYFGFDASGYIDVSTAGNYTFNLSNIDDMARVTVDGTEVVEASVDGNITSNPGVRYLSAGYHSIDIFYYQVCCGFGFDYNATGPGGVAAVYTLTGGVTGGVPEPSTWAMLLLGAVALLFVGGRAAKGVAA